MADNTSKGPGQSEKAAGGDAAGNLRTRIAIAAMELAAVEGWRALRLAQIAEAAGVGLADIHAEFPAKAAILDAFMAEIDRQVLAAGPADADDAARDRLFEVLMRRIDTLAPYKGGVAAVLRDVLDPTVGLIGIPCVLRSMAWMLEAAGLSPNGICGLLRVEGLTAIYANTVRVWLRDDTPDLAPTMAALDLGLRRAESVVGMVGCRGPAPRTAEKPET